MFVHLHVRSWFSFLAGGSSPEQLVERAQALGYTALALTDVNGVYGAIRFHKACRARGIHPVIGAELTVAGFPLVLLAQSPQGYFNLNQLITRAHADSSAPPQLPLGGLRPHAQDLICLTGGKDGRLWRLVHQRHTEEARAWVLQLGEAGFSGLYIELVNGLYPDDKWVMKSLYGLAQELGVPAVATNDVRFAAAQDYRRYDLLTCVRLKRKVGEAHEERPQNAEAYLKEEEELRRLLPFPEALEASGRIAQICQVDLLPEAITPPAARVVPGHSTQSWLACKCLVSLLSKYPAGTLFAALAQLNKEIAVIAQLGLEEFFLVVCEVVEEAQKRGIRCAGRGSAANSIVAYLLDITAVDPLKFNLLFERFLHGGRKGTPDIDVDFDSERRNEIIAWMEERFGTEQTAMTATVVTYRLHSALRDTGKALGWPLSRIDQVTGTLPMLGVSQVREYRDLLQRALGESPLLELLLQMVEQLDGCPRHLGLHAGGMVLSRQHLNSFSPIQISANGVKMVQFDKDDVEALGLIKFDVLGLRMLATLSEAVELLDTTGKEIPDLAQFPLDDEQVFRFIRTGRTLGVFQIESQGQMHLISSHQPTCFEDLITEIALFRPGPLQGGMVHPFIRRRRGEEPVVYDHPDLEKILKDTYGVILFQEQILEIAHLFAGMSLAEADDFRAVMSKFRDAGQMESMRTKFVSGAMARQVPEDVAQRVFDQVSAFVGYGFCRSHAAAFAKTVYHSAWLKCHHPAAFMAAVMQHRPGMYSLMSLEEEAKRCGVEILGPDINRSEVRYSLERLPDRRLAIRKPLCAVRAVSEETARRIVWCRMDGSFRTVEDLMHRVELPGPALENLSASGALDPIAGNRRRALWKAGVLFRKMAVWTDRDQLRLFEQWELTEQDIPPLPELSMVEQMRWDMRTQHSSRVHPLALARRYLNALGVQTIAAIYRWVPLLQDRSAGPSVRIAGLVILRQKPPTAKGMMFITVEDESGFVQCIVPPTLQKQYHDTLMQPFVIVGGQLQGLRNWRCVVLDKVWMLERFSSTQKAEPAAATAAPAVAYSRLVS